MPLVKYLGTSEDPDARKFLEKSGRSPKWHCSRKQQNHGRISFNKATAGLFFPLLILFTKRRCGALKALHAVTLLYLFTIEFMKIKNGKMIVHEVHREGLLKSKMASI